jgi:nickel/cobalt exporter
VKAAAAHHHHHDHEHGHSDTQTIKTGTGSVVLSVFEEGVPPVFRLRFPGGDLPESTELRLQTVRQDGAQQHFGLVSKGDFLESTTSIPEPHNFDAVLEISYGNQSHTFIVPFREADHEHDHAHEELPEVAGSFEDAHEQAHAREIQERFAQREVSTGQIILFGLTGGLLPCPAAFSILIICLQLKQVTLGFAIVAAFSVGLAMTLVATGALAAWSVRHATKRFAGFGELARKAPYISSAFLVLLAGYMIYHGWRGL